MEIVIFIIIQEKKTKQQHTVYTRPIVSTGIINVRGNIFYLLPMVTSFNNTLKPKEYDAPVLLDCHYHLYPILHTFTVVKHQNLQARRRPRIHDSHENPWSNNVLLKLVPLIYCRLILFIMLIIFNCFLLQSANRIHWFYYFLSTQIICSLGFTSSFKNKFSHITSSFCC
jgi:hypothetical protein